VPLLGCCCCLLIAFIFLIIELDQLFLFLVVTISSSLSNIVTIQAAYPPSVAGVGGGQAVAGRCASGMIVAKYSCSCSFLIRR